MKKHYAESQLRKGPHFQGWYFKLLAADGNALGLIPAVHIDKNGRRSASVQLITKNGSWCLNYEENEFFASRKPLQVRAGHSLFTSKGVMLNIECGELSLHGTVSFGPLSSLKSHIMGPFILLSDMECSHDVISMSHSLAGSLILNGEQMDFSGGTGYIESDRGHSFPEKYLWTQCSWNDGGQNAIMLAAARIPLHFFSFSGCICAVQLNGKEHRIASYRGAKIESWSKDGALIRQGKYRLTAELLDNRAHPLKAPSEGIMSRIIEESLCSKVLYRLEYENMVMLEHIDETAGFEFSEN